LYEWKGFDGGSSDDTWISRLGWGVDLDFGIGTSAKTARRLFAVVAGDGVCLADPQLISPAARSTGGVARRGDLSARRPVWRGDFLCAGDSAAFFNRADPLIP